MKTKTLIIALTAAAFLALASLAYAEVSREEYVAKVEPICEKNTKANEATLHNVKAEVKQGKLKPASVAFTKAAKALKSTHAELEAVTPPEADQQHDHQVALPDQDRGRLLRSGRQEAEARQQERRREDGDQADPQRRSGQRHGARLRLSLLQGQYGEVHVVVGHCPEDSDYFEVDDQRIEVIIAERKSRVTGHAGPPDPNPAPADTDEDTGAGAGP